MKRLLAAAVIVLASLGGAVADPGLAGSVWRLVQFTGPGGAVVPPRLERYTLSFNADGQLAMGLDCNRGSARWELQGGRLIVSPGMMTRAFCGDGSMDSRIAADMSRIASFSLAEGRLTLTLEGDAGTYVWEAAAR